MQTYERPVIFELDVPSTVPFGQEHLDPEQRAQFRGSDLALVSFNNGMTRCLKDRYGSARGRTARTNVEDPAAPFRSAVVASAMRGSTDTLVPQES